MKRISRKVTVGLALIAALPIVVPALAQADDWGCQVLLCLANPGGPGQFAQCVPPVEQLWSALRRGDPFPPCDFNSSLNDLPASVLSVIPAGTLANPGAGTGASNTWASGGYCRQDLLYWGGPEQSELLCGATGAINVTIDNGLYTRVWWGVTGLTEVGTGSTLTEYYGSGSTQTVYDPSQSAAQFMQQRQQPGQQGQQGQTDGNGGAR